MQNKRILSIAITALLLFAILAATAPAFAFDATSVVTLSSTSGGFGDTITVSGPAAAFPVGANPFGSVRVYWDNLGTLLNGTAFAAADGSYSVRATIPGGVAGTHFIIVQDSIGTQASATFTVVPALSAGRAPVRVLPGDALTLTGNGFGPNKTVTINFASTTLATPVSITLTAPAVTTNASGSFVASVIVPTTITTAQFDTYTITATDATTPTPNVATASVIVNYYLLVTPSSGPPGITTSITGRIPATTPYTLAIDTVPIASGVTDANGRFTNSFTIPALIGIGAHTVTVTWGVTNTASATLTVTPPPTLTLSAPVGISQQVITVTGAGFVGRANITLTFGTTVVNSTATDSRFGPTSGAGGFTAEFSVPNLAPGAYVVTVTDQFGATASVVGGFTINLAPATRVVTGTTFAQGDIISFDINTTDVAVTSVALMIKDPTGTYWWGTPDLAITWPVVFDLQGHGYTPFTLQLAYGYDNMHLTLPANAPLGAWNWTITLPAASTSLPRVRTGLFTVVAGGVAGVVSTVNSMNQTVNGLSGTLNAINTTLNGLSATITRINSTTATIQTNMGTITTSVSNLNASIASISGNMATLNTNLGTVTASLSSLGGTITGISSSVSGLSSAIATVQTSVGAVQTKLGDLDPVIGLIAGDTTTLKTSVGTITTSLSTIGTQVTGIVGDVATIKTDLGTLTGTVTSISGNIATIQTNLGTMQADISGIKSDVSSNKTTTESLSPLVIVAIVLALIAAIAAIASIVLMRRKIAG